MTMKQQKEIHSEDKINQSINKMQSGPISVIWDGKHTSFKLIRETENKMQFYKEDHWIVL